MLSLSEPVPYRAPFSTSQSKVALAAIQVPTKSLHIRPPNDTYQGTMQGHGAACSQSWKLRHFAGSPLVSGRERSLGFDKYTGMHSKSNGMAGALSFCLSHYVDTASPITMHSSGQTMSRVRKCFLHEWTFFESEVKSHSLLSWHGLLPPLVLLGVSRKTKL